MKGSYIFCDENPLKKANLIKNILIKKLLKIKII